MHREQIVYAGNEANASKALIMVHGRGGSAEDILSLSDHLLIKDYLLLAPQATNYSWYPHSFLAPPARNEPWLSSALQLISTTVQAIGQRGIAKEHIFFLGFSQGACLIAEFTTRYATRYGGIAILTGGLIGDAIITENYRGDFAGTPVFIGTSDPDSHVPVERVHATSAIMKNMHADVTEKVYKGMGHTINGDEISQVNAILFK